MLNVECECRKNCHVETAALALMEAASFVERSGIKDTADSRNKLLKNNPLKYRFPVLALDLQLYSIVNK